MPDIDSARGFMVAARRDAQALANMKDEASFPLEIFGFMPSRPSKKH